MERPNDIFDHTLELELEQIRLAKEGDNEDRAFPVLSEDKETAFNEMLEIEQKIIYKAKKVIGE